MKYYIEAFRGDGSEILGNLDGQNVLRDIRYPERTKAVRSLRSGEDRPKWPKVKRWDVVTQSGSHVATISNPHFNPEAK